MYKPRTLPKHSTPAPTLTADPARIPSLEEVRALPLLQNREIDKIAPLTPMQRDLYLASLFNLDELAFSVGITVKLGKEIDQKRWHQAVALAVEHDDVPKTIFYDYHGQIFQAVTQTPCHFEYIDARNWQGGETELAEFVQKKIAVRYHLFSLQPQWCNYLVVDWRNEYTAIVTTHHILSDGSGMKVFVERVCAVYEALTEQQPIDLSFPSFYTYIPTLSERFDTPETLAYWQEQLHNVVPLPAGKGEPDGYKKVRKLQLVGEELQRIKAYCAQYHYSLPTYFRFLYSALLSRYYAVTEDFVLYNLLNGRTVEAIHTLGCFYEILPIVLKKELFAANTTLDDCFQAMRMYRKLPGPYQHISTLQQKQLFPEEPLRFYYNFYNFGYVHFRGYTLDFRDYDYYGMDEVHLVVDEKPDKLDVLLYYNSTTFNDDAFLERLSGLSQQMMSGAQRLFALDVLLPGERQKLLEWSSPAAAPYPYESCFSFLFESQVARTPDAIAVASDDEQITYATLQQYVLRFAERLKAEGVGTESLVALHCERSISFWIAVLAIFQAGGAYLPLNTSHPARQLSLVLTESRVEFLVTSADGQNMLTQIVSHLPTLHPRVLLLSDLLSAPAERTECSDVAPPDNYPAKLAYVIYTSGSTGLPKGAMVEQGGMVNHLYAKIHDLQLSAGDIIAQNASQSFDISIWQFLAALLVGGRVQIIAEAINRDPASLIEEVERYQVSVLETVPSLLQGLFQQMQMHTITLPTLTALRWLVSTGEPLSTKLAQEWLTHYPDVPLVNGYGPTECSDDVSHALLMSPLDTTTSTISIGRAITNIGLYVLDHTLSLVPPCMPGELYVSGIGVGRGYMHDPEKTAEQFLPDPFRQTSGARLYKTGDIVRYQPDGNLEFIGRADYQVKIRGFRIELSEIEGALARYPAIQQAVVIVSEDQTGDKRLIAYIVSQTGKHPGRGELVDALLEQIPAYMVPATFVFLQEFPLNTHGKIDRQALPIPSTFDTHTTQAGTFHNKIEALLAEIWSQELGIEEIGRDDDFFSSGGNSLSAIRILIRLQEAGQTGVTLRDLFILPTIASLARSINEAL